MEKAGTGAGKSGAVARASGEFSGTSPASTDFSARGQSSEDGAGESPQQQWEVPSQPMGALGVEALGQAQMPTAGAARSSAATTIDIAFIHPPNEASRPFIHPPA